MPEGNDYLKGLTAFIEDSFPKTCATCGTTYQTAAQFLTETEGLPNKRSSLKEALEEDGSIIVEVFRNCPCGSTLMDEFNSRRDDSLQGKDKRDKFEQLIMALLKQQVPIEIARIEIHKLFEGKKTEALDYLLKKTT